MANRKLTTLPLDEEVKATLAMMSLKTIKDVVSLPPYTLMDVLGQTTAQYKDFMDTLLSRCLPPRTTAHDMEERERRNTISLGNPDLDVLLGGGILPGSLYEFVGPPGVGKTQWCLHMSASVVAAGQDGAGVGPAVIYIDTECAARPERLVQMMKSKYPELSPDIPKLLSRIYVFRPQSSADMLEILDSLEFTVVDKDARLLVIDSITSVEESLSTNSRRQRATQLSSWAAKLKALAHDLNICVVVTNQITTMSEPHLRDPDLMEDHQVPGHYTPDPESPAVEARDEMPPPMDPVPDPEDPIPDLENRVPDQGYVTELKGHLVDSTTALENSVTDQGHVTDPDDCVPDLTTGPEIRVPDQGCVADPEGRDDSMRGSEESVDCVKASRAHTPLSEKSVPDQDDLPAPKGPMSMSDQEEGDDSSKASKALIPAMGDTWTHCINTRIVLQYTNSGSRQLVIAKSPVSPFTTLTYYIREDGITVDESDGFYTYNSGVDPCLFRMRPCPKEVVFGSLSKQ